MADETLRSPEGPACSVGLSWLGFDFVLLRLSGEGFGLVGFEVVQASGLGCGSC